jgi:hypothetical protein
LLEGVLAADHFKMLGVAGAVVLEVTEIVIVVKPPVEADRLKRT